MKIKTRIILLRQIYLQPLRAADLFNQTCKAIGFPDSIINNAGVADSSPIEKDIKEWSADLIKQCLNLKSPAIICKVYFKKKNRENIEKAENY